MAQIITDTGIEDTQDQDHHAVVLIVCNDGYGWGKGLTEAAAMKAAQARLAAQTADDGSALPMPELHVLRISGSARVVGITLGRFDLL